MRRFVFILFTVYSLNAQTLLLPVRNVSAFTGSQLYSKLASLSRAAREDSLFTMIAQGNVPDFLRTLTKITTVKTINGTSYTLEYFVTPDYLSIGHDTDNFLMPMTPLLAQRLANLTKCTLPTAKMVDQIYSAADVKLRPQPIPPDANMITVPRFFQHNDSVKALRVPLIPSFPLGSLVGGTKKDVVIDKKVYSWIKGTVPKPVVIYGWHQLNGVPIQPTYNGHEETYADYSHGVRLVQRMAKINGADISLIDILQDPVYYQLLSDTVLIKPYYGSLTAAEGMNEPAPAIFELKQNYPNPFNPSTNVAFRIDAETAVSLKVYDAMGRTVATLVDGPLQKGSYTVRFGGAAGEYSSGVYFCRLQTPTRSQTQKMTLLR